MQTQATDARTPAQNNFDGLRLLGALAVLLGHGFVLTGRGAHVPGAFGFGVHEMGVYIFFCISGFLIASSWNRTRSPWAYWTARSLRIFPALIVVVVMSVVVIGPITTTVGLSAYWRDPLTSHYLENIVLKPLYALPGVFGSSPVNQAVNGSLWSLPAEFFCYIAVPQLLWRRRGVAAAMLIAALVACLFLMRYQPGHLGVFYGTAIGVCVPLWACFAVGSLLRIGVERWPGLLRVDVAVSLVAAFALVVSWRPDLATKLAWTALPFAVLAIGVRSTPFLRDSARFGDLSYGIYLWAFPIQQLVIWRFGHLPMAVDLALVGTATAAMAWLSWHLVEHRAIRLAKRLGRIQWTRTEPVEAAPVEAAEVA